MEESPRVSFSRRLCYARCRPGLRHYGSRKKWIPLADQGAVGIGWLIQLHDLMKSGSNGDLDDGFGYSAP
uniref:Uncharacterized protein n=1 Tax=Vitis vinifera TaxID=29760 RepID=F6HK47_VITVI